MMEVWKLMEVGYRLWKFMGVLCLNFNDVEGCRNIGEKAMNP